MTVSLSRLFSTVFIEYVFALLYVTIIFSKNNTTATNGCRIYGIIPSSKIDNSFKRHKRSV